MGTTVRSHLTSQQPQRRLPALRCQMQRLRMAGEVSIVVDSVTSSPMGSGNCVQDVCNQALGFVTCKVTGGDKLVLSEQPLASSYYAVGEIEGAGESVIVPCNGPVDKGSTLSVASSLAVSIPEGWNRDQAGLFPALCILFLQNLQKAGIPDLSSLRGKTVVVTGGLGPAASLALQLCVAAGAYVVATGSGRDGDKLRALGAQLIIDYKRESFSEALNGDIFVVVDGLGSGSGAEETALGKMDIKYVSVMHPAVALVVRDGLWSGGQALQRHMSGKDDACVFEASEEAMLMIGGAVDVLVAAGMAPRFGKEAYTANEWLEALGWPKDTDTGGRFGFPGKNLWEAPAFTSLAAADAQGFRPVGLPSEEEVYAMDAAAETEALKEVFDKYDADGSGDISREELRAAAQDFRLASSEAELDDLIAKVDTDGDGKISFEEFQAAKIAKVIEVESMGQLLEAVSQGATTLVEFHAPFCRTCRGMRGRFAKLPGRRPDAQFLSVDVKKHRALADELDIKDVPSYLLYKKGQRRGQWKGAFRLDALENFLQTPE